MRRVCLTCITCCILMLCIWNVAAIAHSKARAKKRTTPKPHILSRREGMDLLLGAGIISKRKGNYAKAKELFEGADFSAQMFRDQVVSQGQDDLARITRLEKLIELEGPRADLKSKLDAAKKSVSTARRSNFDFWLVRIRASVAAGEMAEVLGQRVEAVRLYSQGLAFEYILSHQDLSDLSEDQLADFREWGSWPRVKLLKLGEDPVEALRYTESSIKESGKTVPTLPLF